MKHIRLIAHDDDTGNTGLIIKGTPIFDELLASITGGLVAHDLIEHQNGVARIGCPADELEAIGSLWHVRGRNGVFLSRTHNIYTPEQNMGRNVFSIARDLSGDGWWPGTVTYRTRPHHHDESFEEILAVARKLVAAEMECDADFCEDFPVDQFFSDALHLMRIGYRKSERRWGADYQASDLFVAVRDAVDRIIPSVTTPGQEFLLSYGAGSARCKEIKLP